MHIFKNLKQIFFLLVLASSILTFESCSKNKNPEIGEWVLFQKHVTEHGEENDWFTTNDSRTIQFFKDGTFIADPPMFRVEEGEKITYSAEEMIIGKSLRYSFEEQFLIIHLGFENWKDKYYKKKD